jgi:tetratricopeptide (TPR) repeat protein
MEDLVQKALDLVCLNLAQNNLEDAELICEQILKVDNQNLIARYLQRECLKKQGKESESIESEDSDFYNDLGILFLKSKLSEEANELFFRSLILNPKNSHAWCNLAGCYKNKKMYWTAARLLIASLKNKQDKQVWVNLARVYGELGMMKRTISCLGNALEIDNHFLPAQIDLATALFLDGEWEKAWSLYRLRYKYFPSLKNILSLFPEEKMWDGNAVHNKKIVVFSEQGLGDVFNFVQFVKILEEKFPTNDICVFVPNELRIFLKNQGYKIIEEIEDYDFCCSMIDLPWLLSLSKNEVMMKKPFQKTKNLDFSPFKDNYKIGICWGGNPANPRDEHRSCHLSCFREICQIPNVKLFSLQSDVRPRMWPDQNKIVDLSEDCSDMRVVNMQPYMKSWDDTSAVISGLDLVISVDTSVMHLAASLGKPTFGLVAYLPDWRWGLESEDNIWYPSLKLFRQEEIGDWNKPFEKITNKIKDLVRQKHI